jgi:hypothetical protein
MKLTRQKPRFPGDLIQRYQKIAARNKTKKKAESIFIKKDKKSNKKGKK